MKTVTLYTDGACSGNPGPGGWGAILLFGEHKKELSGGEKNTTNNRMELTAVIRGLQALKEPCIVELYSDSKYVITEKGRETCSLTEDSIAFTVKLKAENAVSRFNRQLRRGSFVKTQVIPRESGDYSVIMALDDEAGNLMTLELLAPDQRQAVRLSKLFEKKAEAVYSLTMAELLDEEDSLDE